MADGNIPDENSNREKKHGSPLHTAARIILYSFLIAVCIKAFFIEVYSIPSSSMEDSLLPGDIILVNKAAYKFATPSSFPFLDFPLPSRQLFRTGRPERSEIITFLHPGEPGEIKPSNPVYYIKRVIGLPGDTIRIYNKKVYVNDSLIRHPALSKFRAESQMPDEENDKIVPKGLNWNEDYYGPLVIPRKGMTIPMTEKNFKIYSMTINRELGSSSLKWMKGKAYTRTSEIQSYTFTKDYYFMMGDNRDYSYDSRFWGLVPFENISGKARFIYLSFDRFRENFLSSIRWKRFFISVR